MDTALTSSTATLRPGAAEVAAHDGTGTRLATVCNDDTLKIYATDTGKLELSASMQVSWPNSSTQARISWAPSDFGQVLATSSGATIHIWAEVKQVHRPQGWRLVQSWHAGSQIWDIAFSPKEYGALLAVSCADGKLRIYGGCNDGTSGIWQYEESAMAWVECARLRSDLMGPVACLHWAPQLNRQIDTIATAIYSTVEVWSLDGLGGHGLHPKLITSMEMDARIWKLEWNILGTLLAVSTDSGAVSLFAQNMLGEFDITAKFIGNPQAEDC